MFNTAYQKPDWVVIGVQHGEGVMLLASQELGPTALSMEAEEFFAQELFEPIAYVARRWNLEVEVGSFVIITARTYAEAFVHLTKTWNPDAPRQTQQPEITGRGVIER